jgi:uncharacterized protein (TIGR03084 family)
MNTALTVEKVRADLLAEQADLDAIVAGLTVEQWARLTPSPGWTVADQIGHLMYFDGTAATAITDPEAFTETVAQLLEGMASGASTGSDPTLVEARAMTSLELLRAWRANRLHLAEVSSTLADDDRVVWYGPSMGAKSFLTARLMETWAHGQDIVDTVGASRPPTDRLRHIAQLGYITRGWTYLNRRLAVPDVAVGVELTAPTGGVWRFGPDDAAESVIGPAEDFCLVVTQRRHVDDTDLHVTGEAARDWMLKAQAFAGGPTDGPSPA